MATSGQQCNRCFRGTFQTRGIRENSKHIRYLKCTVCGACDKQVLALENIRRRLKSADIDKR